MDSRWRLYYNDEWLNGHTVEENAAMLIHEVSHLLRDREARKHAAAVADVTLWNTAADCEINDDLLGEGLPLPTIRRSPARAACRRAKPPRCHSQMMKPAQSGSANAYATHQPRTTDQDCGSGAHGERRPWELPDDDGSPGGAST